MIVSLLLRKLSLMIESSLISKSSIIKKLSLMKKLCYSGLMLLVIGTSIICPGTAAASEENGLDLEIIAPGGSDIDLEEECFSYFGSAEQPVLVRAREFSVTARRIDYDRKGEELSAGGDVFLKSKEIEFRTEEILIDLGQESFTAAGGFTLTAGEMELTGRMLTGSIPEGVLTATEDVNWSFRDLQGKADKLVYRQDEEKVYLSGTPVARWGENYMEGTMMILHLETGRITMTGPVKSRLQP